MLLFGHIYICIFFGNLREPNDGNARCSRVDLQHKMVHANDSQLGSPSEKGPGQGLSAAARAPTRSRQKHAVRPPVPVCSILLTSAADDRVKPSWSQRPSPQMHHQLLSVSQYWYWY